MYQAFFGLQESPFSITPDTDFFYAYPSHQQAFDTLWVALHAGEGFIKIIGEVGTFQVGILFTVTLMVLN